MCEAYGVEYFESYSQALGSRLESHNINYLEFDEITQ